jgi:hypothetical protein
MKISVQELRRIIRETSRDLEGYGQIHYPPGYPSEESEETKGLTAEEENDAAWERGFKAGLNDEPVADGQPHSYYDGYSQGQTGEYPSPPKGIGPWQGPGADVGVSAPPYPMADQLEDVMSGEELEAIGAGYDEAGNLLPTSQAEDDFVYIDVTTTGATPSVPPDITFDIWDKLEGVKTGFGIIENPYYIEEGEIGHDPHWRRKDGRTVIGVPEDHERAIPVADAYFLLYKETHDEGYKTPIDKMMGWTVPAPWWEREDVDDPVDWEAEDLRKSIRSYEMEMGWDPRDPEDYVKTVGGYMIRMEKEEAEGEDLPKHSGMGRRPSGRHGRGQLSESVMRRWVKLSGLKN